MLYEPIKKLGQNFLIDADIAFQMVSLLDLAPDDAVVEVGPGLGALTQVLLDELSDPAAKVYAVEIDVRLVAKLDRMFLPHPNCKIIEGDILEWFPAFESATDFKLLGSLPFYITSPIVHIIIKRRKRPQVCVLLIQKEVAQKICAKVPDASYLSTFVQTFFDTSYEAFVPKEKFDPAPKVDGAIIKLARRASPIEFGRLSYYEGFLHKGFSNPRKMLNKVFTKDELAKVGVDGSLRPQNINVNKWVEMFKVLTPQ